MVALHILHVLDHSIANRVASHLAACRRAIGSRDHLAPAGSCGAMRGAYERAHFDRRLLTPLLSAAPIEDLCW